MLITRELSQRLETIKESILNKGLEEYQARKKGKHLDNSHLIVDVLAIECLEYGIEDDVLSDQLLSYLSNKYLIGQKNPNLIRNDNY